MDTVLSINKVSIAFFLVLVVLGTGFVYEAAAVPFVSDKLWQRDSVMLVP